MTAPMPQSRTHTRNTYAAQRNLRAAHAQETRAAVLRFRDQTVRDELDPARLVIGALAGALDQHFDDTIDRLARDHAAFRARFGIGE